MMQSIEKEVSMSEAGELEEKIQALTVQQQAACLRFVLGYMSGKPEWPALKEAVELYLEE